MTKLMCALPVRVMNSSSMSGLIAFNFWPIWATTTMSMSSRLALWTMLSPSLPISIKKRKPFKASFTARIVWRLRMGSSSRISGLFRIGISRISSWLIIWLILLGFRSLTEYPFFNFWPIVKIANFRALRRCSLKWALFLMWEIIWSKNWPWRVYSILRKPISLKSMKTVKKCDYSYTFTFTIVLKVFCWKTWDWLFCFEMIVPLYFKYSYKNHKVYHSTFVFLSFSGICLHFLALSCSFGIIHDDKSILHASFESWFFVVVNNRLKYKKLNIFSTIQQ